MKCRSKFPLTILEINLNNCDIRFLFNRIHPAERYWFNIQDVEFIHYAPVIILVSLGVRLCCLMRGGLPAGILGSCAMFFFGFSWHCSVESDISARTA